MKWLVIALGGIGVLVVGFAVYQNGFANPRVIRELQDDPDGERAKKVMLLGLPSGKELPVNYLRDGRMVYCAADFPWWRELKDGGGRGTVLIRGEVLQGRVRAVLDDPTLRDSVFERLRPTAPRFLGTLVVIELD